MRFCSLGSGSKGNATLLSYKNTLLLIDCGFSQRETLKRLNSKGISVEQITAILVTHEHSDHISGVAGLANKFSIPVWLTKGTSLSDKANFTSVTNYLNNHDSFFIGDIDITPVAVPHDAREATQFTFQMGKVKLGLLTDVGHITRHIVDKYSNCHVLLLEFNYDLQMLIAGKYPYKLKQRVSGSLGHLSNEQSIEFLEKVNTTDCGILIAMHKSEQNNSTELILNALSKISKCANMKLSVAEQAFGFEWVEI